jgi:hypothetical protein
VRRLAQRGARHEGEQAALQPRLLLVGEQPERHRRVEQAEGQQPLDRLGRHRAARHEPAADVGAEHRAVGRALVVDPVDADLDRLRGGDEHRGALAVRRLAIRRGVVGVVGVVLLFVVLVLFVVLDDVVVRGVVGPVRPRLVVVLGVVLVAVGVVRLVGHGGSFLVGRGAARNGAPHGAPGHLAPLLKVRAAGGAR